MLIHKYLSLVLFWLHLLVAQSCDPFYSQENFKLEGHVNVTIPSFKKGHCIEKCSLHTGCHSINFYQDKDLCDLNNANHLSNPESLVYLHGSQFINNFKRPINECSDKLCSDPLNCIMNRDGQTYRCDTCKGRNGTVLLFPRKSKYDRVELEYPFNHNLTSFTLSMWVQIDPSAETPHTVFSYATNDEDNDIRVYLRRSYSRFSIKSTNEKVYHSVIDGKWHHIGTTWDNSDGNWILYLDGTKVGGGVLHAGHVIKEGAVILGQDQDRYMGGYESYQAFQGNITSVNMWDRVLSVIEVSALANKCPSDGGNIVKWEDLLYRTTGDVQLVCDPFCA